MTKKQYIPGSKGSKPTPTAIPNKPLPPSVQTIDQSLFTKATKSKGK